MTFVIGTLFRARDQGRGHLAVAAGRHRRFRAATPPIPSVLARSGRSPGLCFMARDCNPAAQQESSGRAWADGSVSPPRRSSGRGMARDGLYPWWACAPAPADIPTSRWVTAQEQRQGMARMACIPGRFAPPASADPHVPVITAQGAASGHGRGCPSRHVQEPAVVGGRCRQAGATEVPTRPGGHPVPGCGRRARTWRGPPPRMARPSGLADEPIREQQDHRTDEGVQIDPSRPLPMATPSRQQPAGEHRADDADHDIAAHRSRGHAGPGWLRQRRCR